MLRTNPFVIVIALDFSKAFDTVRHATLMEKLANLGLPDHVYNWMASFFEGHSHCTIFADNVSLFAEIYLQGLFKVQASAKFQILCLHLTCTHLSSQ